MKTHRKKQIIVAAATLSAVLALCGQWSEAHGPLPHPGPMPPPHGSIFGLDSRSALGRFQEVPVEGVTGQIFQDDPHGGTTRGSEFIDVIFIIDSSASISADVFALQKQGIINCLCGPEAFVPHNGLVAIAVIQFSYNAYVRVPLTVLDSQATANAVCNDIAGIPYIAGGTQLVRALNAAQNILNTQATGTQRVMVISTDGGVTDSTQCLQQCEALRTMPIPVKICTVRVGVICACPPVSEQAFLKACSNTADSPDFQPSQPEGLYACADDPGGADEYRLLCDDCFFDCNDNGILDPCDIDCGSFGGDCDVPGCGGSEDCNSNNVPDECELGGTSDCNSNGYIDTCDVHDGRSQDCNLSGIPDECEFGYDLDCNGNGVPDSCDLYSGFSEDCQANGIPDECEEICSCAGWSGQFAPPGTDGAVLAMTEWDEDDTGPKRPALYLGGAFTTAGGQPANNIARWNGSSWQPLGSGMDGWVFALTVYNGALIAGGWFTSAGGQAANYIARWNGSSWQPLNNGMNGPVYALTVYNGELIAGGNFTTADGLTANYIACWNGSSWQSLGSGTNGQINALTEYNEELIAGGYFTIPGVQGTNNIARWDGSIWRPLGTGTNNSVSALTVYNEDLIAGGDFTTAGGQSANYIACWNGSIWQRLPSEVNWGVRALAVYGTELIAGGNFTTAGGQPANAIARWNGSIWRPLDSGVSGQDPKWGVLSVQALTVYNEKLFAGGFFTTAGEQSVNYIACWNGSSWQALGSGMGGSFLPSVDALTVYNGELIAGGNFTTAGGQSANYIARWNGSAWQPLDSGVSGDTFPLHSTVSALTVYREELIAGGKFTTAGGQPANGIARWNGSSWLPLGSGMSAGGSPSTVSALTVYRGELIAGGRFTTADGQFASSIAAWNGSSWRPLDSGVGSDFEDPHVFALTVYNTELIAGGYFDRAGGQPVNDIAAWNGSSWRTLGSGTDGLDASVYALTVYGEELIAGGSFDNAGHFEKRIARWNGFSWQPLGSGIGWDEEGVVPVSPFVSALTVYNEELIAGGGFTTAGGLPAKAIARWDGCSWQALGSGMGIVYALTVYNGDLFAGGGFNTAGNTQSSHIAQWSDEGTWLHIRRQPMDVMVDSGELATFVIDAIGSPTLTYQWFHNGEQLQDDGRIMGSTTPTLTITSVQPSDTGDYHVVVDNACATLTSATATLTVTVTEECPPTLLGARSIATHATGEFYVDLDITDNPATRTREPRSTGIQVLDLGFDQPILSGSITLNPGGATAPITPGAGTFGFNGGRATLASAQTNNRVYTITITANTGPGCDLTQDICVTAQVGDFDDNDRVTSADKGALTGFVFQTVSQANAKFDVFVGGGATINASDVGFWTGFFGTTNVGEACP